MIFKKINNIKDLLIGKQDEYELTFIQSIAEFYGHYETFDLRENIVFRTHFLVVNGNYYYDGWFWSGVMTAEYRLICEYYDI